MKCEGIIFDLDGVIADTETHFLTATQQAASEKGFVVTEEEFIHRTVIKGESIFEAHPHISPEKTKSIRRRRDQLYMQFLSDRLRISEEVRQAIDTLSPHFRLGIGTSSKKQYVDLILDLLERKSTFQSIVTREDVARLKPFPDIYLKVVSELGLSPEQTYVVEDSEKGVKAGKEAGCRVIALSCGRYSKLQNYSLADSIVSSMAEAQRLLMADI